MHKILPLLVAFVSQTAMSQQTPFVPFAQPQARPWILAGPKTPDLMGSDLNPLFHQEPDSAGLSPGTWIQISPYGHLYEPALYHLTLNGARIHVLLPDYMRCLRPKPGSVDHMPLLRGNDAPPAAAMPNAYPTAGTRLSLP